jgi:cyclophilin family peptidyl-prolyl cis-trans isomerase
VVDVVLNESTEVAISSVSGIFVGQTVRGDGIPQDATVSAVTEVGITLSVPSTRTGTSRLRFGTQHVRGVLSMAHSSAANSAGSQFFVVTKDAPHLDGGYAAFGRLISGDDVLTALSEVEVGTSAGGESSLPVKMPKIKSVKTFGSQPLSKASFSGRTFGGGLFPESGVDFGAWGLLSNFPVGTASDSQAVLEDRAQTRGELFGRLFAPRSSGYWTATLGPVGKTSQSCSLKLKVNPDNLLGTSSDIPVVVTMYDRGGGVFSGVAARSAILASGQIPKKTGETDSYYFVKKLSGVSVERRSWQGTGSQVRVTVELLQNVYNVRTNAEVSSEATSAKFLGFSSDIPAQVATRHTATISAPGDLLADGGFDYRRGEFSPVPVVAGNGYLSSSVVQGLFSAVVKLPNDRSASMSLPARMSGLRCLIPVSHAAVSAGAFVRLSGQFELGAGATVGEIDWFHWPKSSGERITDYFYGRSSLKVEPYAAAPVGRLGLFSSGDTVASLQLFGQITKKLSVGSVPRRGVQALAEIPSASNKSPARITVDPTTGVFTGTFQEYTSANKWVKRNIAGVLLQSSRIGRGYSARDSEVIATDLSATVP